MDSESEQSPMVPKEKSKIESLSESISELIALDRDMHISFFLLMIIVFTASAAFFTSMVYFIEVWDLSETTSGFICLLAGVVGISIRVFVGSFIEYVGIKNSLLIGSSTSIISFFIIAFVEVLWVQIFIITTIVTISWAVQLVAVMIIGNLLIPPQTMAIANSWAIFCKNLAFLGFGLVYQLVISIYDETMEGFAVLFAITGGINIVCLACTLILKHKSLDKVIKDNRKLIYHQHALSPLLETINLKRFWRLTCLITLLAIPSATFNQAVVILPIQMDREMDGDFAYGYILALRSLILAIFCLTSTIFVYYMELYNSISLSSAILTGSVLIFTAGSNYWVVIAYVIVSSFANSILEPRIYEYSMNMSYSGKDGIFMSVASTNFNMSLLIAGVMGGFLLSEYCPEDGERDCWAMWYWVGGLNLVATILLIVLKKWLYQPFSQQEIDSYVN